MDPEKFYDTHTLYVTTGLATAKQLSECINSAVSQVSKKLRRGITTTFKTNIIHDRSGASMEFGFLWITNPEVYHMLLGRNPDGSERVILKDDPSWISCDEKEKKKDQETEEIDLLEDFETSTFEWGLEETENDKLKVPQIRIEQEPLMVLPPYTYTSEQYEKMKKKIRSERDIIRRAEIAQCKLTCVDSPPSPSSHDDSSITLSSSQEDNDSLEDYPLQGNILVEPAFVVEVEEGISHNILWTSHLPSWITHGDLKKEFSKFTTDVNKKVSYRDKSTNKFVDDTYPVVNIDRNRHEVTITFDPIRRDAQFALHMSKKLTFTKGNNNCQLFFNLNRKSRV